MMIYEKLESTFEKYTGKSQCGGMKNNDTIEHLMMIMSIVKDLERGKQGIILTFCDIKKCFDRCHLDDMMYNLLKHEVDIKAIRMFQRTSGENFLRIQGGKKYINIKRGLGQGGVNAPRAYSGGITECHERYTIHHSDPVSHNGINVPSMGCVDDAALIDKTARGAKVSGMIITNTFGELALDAHTDKTVQ